MNKIMPLLCEEFPLDHPFYDVLESDDEEGLLTLLEQGVKIDSTDVFGNTALHLAAKMGKDLCVKHLIMSGARIDVKNNDGSYACDLIHYGASSAVKKWMDPNRMQDNNASFVSFSHQAIELEMPAYVSKKAL